MSFLTAEWRKLAISNYVIDKNLLAEYLPIGTELDLWNNKCYVSLVGFMFQNTRLLGIKIPFHINFEEVNLRFYVKRLENGVWKRGVVFIKEIVPKRALTFIANSIYRENYTTLPMKHRWEVKNNQRIVEYQWRRNKKWHKIYIQATQKRFEIEANSEAEFITEHYWGYTKGNDLTIEYEVTHPKWKKYKILKYEINVDFGANYGQDFDFLNQVKPTSIMLAEGSKIAVEHKRKIEKNAMQ